VRGRQEGRKRLRHRQFGTLDLEFTILHIAEQPSLRLYLYTPADDGATERALCGAARPDGSAFMGGSSRRASRP
jgi:hypothetical protein